MFMFEYRIWKQRLLLHWLFFDVLWFIHNKSPCNLYCKQQIMLLTTPTLHRRPLDVAQKKWLPLEMLSILVYTYLVYGTTRMFPSNVVANHQFMFVYRALSGSTDRFPRPRKRR
jgi:hypothetical protein